MQGEEVEKRTRGNPNWTKKKEESLVVDEGIIKETKLSDFLSEIRGVLNRFQNELSFKVEEKGGKIVGLEITAKIKL